MKPYRKGKHNKNKQNTTTTTAASSSSASSNTTTVDTDCLVRISNGSQSFSTIVSSKEVVRFQIAYATLIKGYVDNLERPSRKSDKHRRAKKATI